MIAAKISHLVKLTSVHFKILLTDLCHSISALPDGCAGPREEEVPRSVEVSDDENSRCACAILRSARKSMQCRADPTDIFFVIGLHPLDVNLNANEAVLLEDPPTPINRVSGTNVRIVVLG